MTEVALAMLLAQMPDARQEAPHLVELLVHAYSAFTAQLGPEHPETRQLADLLRRMGLAR